jgi:transcriptional regulator with XRE-family HTH domain
VRELARRAGVTPGAVTQWEDSERRGVIRRSTIDRALHALGTSLAEEETATGSRDLERREDRVTLELHRVVAHKLVDHPDAVTADAIRHLALLRKRVRGDSAHALVDEWERLLTAGRLGALIDVLLGTDSWAVDMRQVSPFAGALSDDERLAAIGRAA